jgi:hypothetical protein
MYSQDYSDPDLLPTKPHVELINRSDKNKIDIEVKMFSERADKYEIILKEYENPRIYTTIWDIDNPDNFTYDHYSIDFYENCDSVLFIIVAVNEYGGTSSDPYVIINNHATALQIIDNDYLSIYPNPAKDVLFFRGKWDSIELISIVDTSGRVVKHFQNIKSENIDISDLHRGLYLVNVKFKDSLEPKIFKLVTR